MRRALALLLLAVSLAGCTDGADHGRTPSPSTDVASVETNLQPCPEQSGEAAAGDAPRVSLECFGGGTLDLRKAPGVPTVVNLWASWCGPCREELPIVAQLAASAGNHVRVLTVNSEDGIPQATSFAADTDLTLPTAYDGEGELAAALGLRGLPYTVFLAADGSVAYVQTKPVTSLEEFESLVAAHLGVQL